ncbi:MAG: diguanylate cyclase [Desulfuromonas sp.]|nr:diguanylate cyclase [Desulfuromonas sp.]
MANHKRSLRDIVTIAATALRRIHQEYQQGNFSYADAKKKALAAISTFHYANEDYLYLCDYAGNFVYHPDSSLNGTNGAKLKDANGQLILLPMIAKARASGADFYDYFWPRLGVAEPMHKLTYTMDLPQWGWIVTTGVYLEDVQRETSARKQELIAFLREFVRSARIAKSGYIYVFDGDMNMIIHPNKNIEQTNFGQLKDPMTGKSLGQELMQAAQSKDAKLVYQWDKPADPGNYVYQKVAWVRYLPEHDYYVASSVYMHDLQSSGKLLAKRLFQISMVTIMLIVLLGSVLIYNAIYAIKKLALVANKIVGGDLSEKAQVIRTDEIGQLGHSFNLMVDKLRDQIDTLEARVAGRTAAQTQLVAQMEQYNIETTMLKNANEVLQECRNSEEVYRAVRIIMYKAFPATSGSLFSLGYDGQKLEVVADWNCPADNMGSVYDYDACMSMRRGTTYMYAGDERKLPCPHLGDNIHARTICTPINAYGETFGVLSVRHEKLPEEQLQRMVKLIEDINEYIASALANLRLRARLQQQSIRDPLTGLFNRRYMDEVLHQEESRARRNATQVGIIMMDVDHFKHFNDTYGHEAGDEMLRVLGKILHGHFRDSDITCRYGGEEFIAIMPDISLEQCQAKAEQLRSVVERSANMVHMGEVLAISLSLGVALFPLHGKDMHSVLKLADKALYQAKEQGRNRVVSAGA